MFLFFFLLINMVSAIDIECAPGLCPPEQIHMMLRPDGIGVSFLWQTFAKSKNSSVWLGIKSNQYTRQVSSTRQQSITNSQYGQNILFDHLVDVPGLLDNTEYYYRVGCLIGGQSEEFIFRTGSQPKVTSARVQTRVAILGDLGLANSQNTIKLLQREMGVAANGTNGLDFIMHVGDIGYGNDYDEFLYERVWAQFFYNMKSVMRFVPYMTAPGNHEYSASCGASCPQSVVGFKTYTMRFALPVKTYAGNTPMWYSFNRGPVHYVITSTETDYLGAFYPTQFGDQMKWLAADLAQAQVDIKLRPWVVVIGHRPIYSSMKGFVECDRFQTACWPDGQAKIVQNGFESLFVQYNVDLVFNGHVHSYSRQIGVKDGGKHYSAATHNADMPWYVVSGGAGNEEGLSKGHIQHVPWVGHIYEDGYGAGVLEVGVDTQKQVHTATYNHYRATDGGLEDTFTLTKDM